MKEFKVTPIRNGTVIDHIDCGMALKVLRIIGMADGGKVQSPVSVLMHVPSKKEGWKDVVKVEDRELDPATVDKIALIAPDATIVIIRDYYIAEKFNVALADHITGLARCSNPDCITNKGEPVEPEFDVVNRRPPTLKCSYCDRILTRISDNLL